jgi:hypothetical protein
MSVFLPTMETFRSVSSKFGGLAKGCRFLAKIEPGNGLLSTIPNAKSMSEDLMYLCETAELPGRGFNNVDVRYYGPGFKLPFQSSYEDINMVFLTRMNSFERRFFDDWLDVINPVNQFHFEYRDNYKAKIKLFQIRETGRLPNQPPSDKQNITYQFTLNDAFPILVNPQQVTWADDQFLRLGITFTYHWWERENIDTPGSTSPNIGTQRANINIGFINRE